MRVFVDIGVVGVEPCALCKGWGRMAGGVSCGEERRAGGSRWWDWGLGRYPSLERSLG